MLVREVKLKLTRQQELDLERWLFHLASVWNWAIRKIENDGRDGIWYSEKTFHNLLAGHSRKLDIPSHVIQGILTTAHKSWSRCFKRLAGRPRFKGRRNRLNSIPFPDPFSRPVSNTIRCRGLKTLKFHKQDIPEGKIKSGRIVKRASGWYACLFIQADAAPIPRIAEGQIGIDPGFNSLLTFSTGEKITRPRELEASALRLAQAQRGRTLTFHELSF